MNDIGTPVTWYLQNGQLVNASIPTQKLKVMNRMGYLAEDSGFIGINSITRQADGSYRFYCTVPGYPNYYLLDCDGGAVGFDNPSAAVAGCGATGSNYNWTVEFVSGSVSTPPSVPLPSPPTSSMSAPVAVYSSPAAVYSSPTAVYSSPVATVSTPLIATVSPAPSPAEEGMSPAMIAAIILLILCCCAGIAFVVMKKKK